MTFTPVESLKRFAPLGLQPPTEDHLRLLRITQAVGALALLVAGGVHLEQYYVALFRIVPTIGPLFLANFIGATLFGLVLLVPLRRGAECTWLALGSLVAVAGIGLSVGAIAGLLISEQAPLFGFMEHGYRLEIVLALAAEAVATLSLSVFLACIVRWTPRRSRRKRPPSRATRPSASPTPSES